MSSTNPSMKKLTDPDGTQSGWFNKDTTKKEYSRWTIKQLVVVAKTRRGFKQLLVNFLAKDPLEGQL